MLLTSSFVFLGNESLYEYERPRGDVAASHYGGRQCRHRQVIRQVSAEYGLTADKGYTVADPNLDELYELYSQPGSAYWVVEQEGEVVGGGGVAPLACSEPDICELQKMYFMTSARGQGWRRSWRCWRWTTPANKGLSAAIWKPPPS